MNKLVSSFLFFVSTIAFSQAGGEDVFSFLNLPTSPKQIALGGQVLTLEDDVSQTLWNPSIANEKMDNDVAVNYISYIEGIKVGSLAYCKVLPKKIGVLTGDIQFLDYGKTARTEAYDATQIGTWSANDLSLGLGYAYQYKQLSAGVKLKYVNSTIDIYSAHAFLYDFAITFQSKDKPLIVAVAVRNNSQQSVQFLEQEYNIQQKISLSTSYKLSHVPLKIFGTIDEINNWNISASNPSREIVDLDGSVSPESISDINNALRHLSLGAELWPDKKLNLRVGYNFRKAIEYQLKEVRTNAGLSYGVGFKTKKIDLNYAYAKFQEGAKYNTFGLVLHL